MRRRLTSASPWTVAVVLALACASAAAALPLRPVGSEFLVNQFTPVRDWKSAVAANADGFVVVWHSTNDLDGDSDGVFARRFASDGTPRGGAFQVNTYSTGYQYYADVAMNAAGDFIVVWQSFGQDEFSNGVFAQRFASDGAPRGVEFQVNTTTSRDERQGAVAIDTAGSFVVAWTSFLGDGSSDAVLAQRFDSTGAKLGGEVLVNTFTTSTQQRPRVAMTAASFVVVWQSYGQDQFFDYGVFGQRFGSNGTALGGEFQINERTQLQQWRPDVAMNASGAFVVVWDSFQGLSDREAMARRFDSSGAALGAELVVNTQTLSFQQLATVAIDGTGAFVVAWASHVDDVSRYEDVFARYYDSTGVAQGLEFQLNSSESNAFGPNRQDQPAIATMGEGSFIVAWESRTGVGNDYDIFARRIGALAMLDADADGTLEPLTDGQLVIRYLFGFAGASLISGALGNGCGRCTAEAISAYLMGLGAILDLDGSGGSPRALSDGMLFLRFLSGYNDPALTAGATLAGCTRCDETALTTYLQPLM